ncbi:hypothetical protein GIB67_011567 [Kingdonia uniflora]|uniref:Uncharacterized protein n=1 Tax=Kingdonia uniflora TaxID=39325 RepID=A0A7J7NMK4_9MAGN|nr:hypothetical protein GIB67_011567 [Kingdonia uniflora]
MEPIPIQEAYQEVDGGPAGVKQIKNLLRRVRISAKEHLSEESGNHNPREGHVTYPTIVARKYMTQEYGVRQIKEILKAQSPTNRIYNRLQKIPIEQELLDVCFENLYDGSSHYLKDPSQLSNSLSADVSMGGDPTGVGKKPLRRLGRMSDALSIASNLGFSIPLSPSSTQEEALQSLSTTTGDKNDNLIRVLRELTVAQC